MYFRDAWCVLLLLLLCHPRVIHASEVHLTANTGSDEQLPGTSSGAAAPDAVRDAGPGEQHPSSLLLADDVVRYADDIYSQSGGMRVRRTKDLTPLGRAVVRQFMFDERRAQRAYIWHALGLDEINFVHHGGNAPLIQPTVLRDIVQYSDAELKDVFNVLAVDFATREDIIENFRDLQRDLALPDSNAGLTFDHARNVAWNMDHVPIFIDSMINRPRYNDMPGAHVDQSADPMAYMASIDPRYRNNDAVVNYRANSRTLALERIAPFHILQPDLVLGPYVHDDLLVELRKLTTTVYPSREDSLYQLIKHEHSAPDQEKRIILDVNVDALGDNVPLEAIYKSISHSVDTQIADTLAHRSGAVTEATGVLQEMIHQDTRVAIKYAKFVKDAWRSVRFINLDSVAPMVDNIERVYQRALFRRQKFHRMTIPFMPSYNDKAHTPGLSYRVHFTDPESRYATLPDEIIAERSLEWYKTMWRRLLEPIMKKTIIPEIITTPFRDIVLGHFDSNVNRRGSLAYETRFGEMVLDCTNVNMNHNDVERTLRHEYEHTVDYATNLRTRKWYEDMVDEDDLSTYTEDALEHADALDANLVADAKESWESRKENTQYTVNSDNDGGFVSAYAQTDAAEVVAEQFAAMRNEPMRIALLQRMSLHKTDKGARRQKEFYDKARENMRDVAPRLYEEWGTYYDANPEEQWGLAEGATRKTDRQFQILELDHSLATKMTSEKLGARLLLEGYGVAIMGYHDQEVPLPECRLQSNVADPATAQLTPTQPSRAPKSILHVVSKGNLPADHAMDAIVDVFSDFTHTGRPLNGRDANMGFDTVSFVFPAGEMTNGGEEEFLADFDVEFREKAKSPGATQSLQSADHAMVGNAGPTMEIFRDTSMWPEDTNLHRTSIFDGWLVNGVDVLEKADMEEYRIRETEDMCI